MLFTTLCGQSWGQKEKLCITDAGTISIKKQK